MKLRLVPDSLLGRLLAALLAVVGVTLLVIVLLIVRERRDLIFWGGETPAVADAIAATSAVLAGLPADARAAELARLRAGALEVSRRSDSRAPPPRPEDIAPAARSLRGRLQRELGGAYGVEVRPARPGPAEVIRVRLQPGRSPGAGPPGEEPGRDGGPGGRPQRGPDPSGRDFGPGQGPGGPPGGGGFPGRPAGGGPPRELDVAVRLPDGAEVTFRTDVPRAGPPLPRQIFVELLVLTVVLGGVLYFMARTITRPLTELARAADAVGRGERQQPLRESGARELRDATRAFNDMRERLNRYLDSRTQVLAAMSHDLRTPLTRLKLRAESIEDDVQRERFVADLDEMSSMVSGALNLFRGLNEDEPRSAVQIDALLEELRAELAELGASVTVTGVAHEPIVVKPQAVKRCLTNLLTNAVKYGTRATVVVENSERELVLRVLDEGPGIPEPMLERVFEPFFRLESSRNADTGGTGLGLSIARDVAQAHGGSLVLRNRSPHGLEAILRLPRAEAGA